MSKRRTSLVLVMVVLMLGAPLTGSVTADVTGTDTEASDTSFQSEIQANDNVTDVTKNDSAVHSTTVTAENATTDPVMEIHGNNSEEIIHENASMTEVSADQPGGSYWNGSFSEADVIDVERSPNENVTVVFWYYNNSTDDSVDHEINPVFLEFGDNRSVERVTDDDVDESPDDMTLTIHEDDPREVFGANIPFTGKDRSTISAEDRSVNGSDSDVVLVLSNSTVEDDFDRAATDAASGDKLSNAGLFSGRTKVLVESDDAIVAAPVFYESVPDSVDDDTTYAVYDEDFGGETSVVVNLGSEFDDADEVTVRAAGNVGIGTWMVEYIKASGLNPLSINGNAFAGAVVLAAAPRRRRRRPIAATNAPVQAGV